MTTIPFRDLLELSPHEFRRDNMIRFFGAQPLYLEIATGRIVLERPWRIVGWSDRIDAALMAGREGQTAIMLAHPQHGEYWEHYPFLDADHRDSALFESVARRLT